MVFKQTWLNITDGTTVRWLQTFHLYKGFKRGVSYPGDFVKGSVRVVSPPRFEYKGFKFKYNVKGNICRGLITRAQKVYSIGDGTRSNFLSNDAVLIKKKQNVKSKYVYGPIEKRIKRARFRTLFKTVI